MKEPAALLPGVLGPRPISGAGEQSKVTLTSPVLDSDCWSHITTQAFLLTSLCLSFLDYKCLSLIEFSEN